MITILQYGVHVWFTKIWKKVKILFNFENVLINYFNNQSKIYRAFLFGSGYERDVSSIQGVLQQCRRFALYIDREAADPFVRNLALDPLRLTRS